MVSPAAVIGGEGFIGSRAVARLRAAGVPVKAFTRAAAFTAQDGSLVRDLVAARTVLYLATSVTPTSAERDPGLAAADVTAFRHLVTQLAWAGEGPRVVLASSGGYLYAGASPPPHREDAPLGPESVYGRAKLEQESVLREHAEAVPSLILRIANVYGPGQLTRPGQGVIAHWLARARAGLPLELYGDPTVTRDFVYVDDVVDALVATHAVRDHLPPVLNIGSGVPTSLGDLARCVRASVGGALRVQRMPGRSFDRARDLWLDVRGAEEALGWWARTSLGVGVERAWRDLGTTSGGRADLGRTA